MDHIVADGMSLGILWREIEALYPAFRNGAALAPPAAGEAVRRVRRGAAAVAGDAGVREAARLVEGSPPRAPRPAICRPTGPARP